MKTLSVTVAAGVHLFEDGRHSLTFGGEGEADLVNWQVVFLKNSCIAVHSFN